MYKCCRDVNVRVWALFALFVIIRYVIITFHEPHVFVVSATGCSLFVQSNICSINLLHLLVWDDDSNIIPSPFTRPFRKLKGGTCDCVLEIILNPFLNDVSVYLDAQITVTHGHRDSNNYSSFLSYNYSFR